MKKMMQRIDRYCTLHPNFGIRRLMLYIVIGNIAVYLLALMDTTHTLSSLLAFDASAIFTKGEVWRLITFIFVPEYSNILFLLIGLYFYYFIGTTLEHQWGSGKFTIYYLIGMLLNIVYGTIVWLITGKSVQVTATYLNLSMFFAFATLFPDTIVLLFFIIPIKMKWLAIIDAAFFVYEVIAMLVGGYGLISFLPIVAVLNYLLFCGDWLFDRIRPANVKQKQKTINYKKAAKKYNKEQAGKPYNYKCSVCGRTDTDYPDLEFRYCSRCVGYHCFCMDHINNHVHFKE